MLKIKEDIMARRGENIFKRTDGRWEGRYEKGREPSGKIKYGYCYGRTYREAKQKVNTAKNDVMNGKIFEAEKMNKCFAIYCDEWLEKQRIELKQSTIVKYEIVVEKHIKPKLGEYRLKMLDSEACARFRNELDKNLSVKTVRDILTVLKSIFKYISSMIPAFGNRIEIVFPKTAKQEMRVLSVDEQKCFVNYLIENMDNCSFGILLSVMTGLRIGEICALTWRDISIKEETIFVHATMQRLRCYEEGCHTKTKVVIGTPKSEKSRRSIPLTHELLDLCMKMNPNLPDAYILTGDRSFMEPRTLQHRLKKITDICCLDGVHFHTLRHTFATRCVEVGFELKSLSEILGHANTTITLDRYVHSSLKLKRENMEKLTMGI